MMVRSGTVPVLGVEGLGNFGILGEVAGRCPL
jgi:hypothetical protein